MSQKKQRINVMLSGQSISVLDRARADVRAETGQPIDRSELIAVIIESADVLAVARTIAKEGKS